MMKNKKFAAALALILAACCACRAEAGISHEAAKKIWHKVAVPTGLTQLPFSIREDKAPNAWVTNGESVTVTTALLDLLDTDAELFAVFAHEAGHVKLNHYQSDVTRGTGLYVVSTLLGRFLGDGIPGMAVNLGANLVSSGWSREQEIASDDYAVTLAHENGVNPVGMYSAIKKLSSVHKTEPSGFNSHPPDDRRIAHIRNKILKLDPKAEFPD